MQQLLAPQGDDRLMYDADQLMLLDHLSKPEIFVQFKKLVFRGWGRVGELINQNLTSLFEGFDGVGLVHATGVIKSGSLKILMLGGEREVSVMFNFGEPKELPEQRVDELKRMVHDSLDEFVKEKLRKTGSIPYQEANDFIESVLLENPDVWLEMAHNSRVRLAIVKKPFDKLVTGFIATGCTGMFSMNERFSIDISDNVLLTPNKTVYGALNRTVERTFGMMDDGRISRIQANDMLDAELCDAVYAGLKKTMRESSRGDWFDPSICTVEYLRQCRDDAIKKGDDEAVLAYTAMILARTAYTVEYK